MRETTCEVMEACERILKARTIGCRRGVTLFGPVQVIGKNNGRKPTIGDDIIESGNHGDLTRTSRLASPLNWRESRSIKPKGVRQAFAYILAPRAQKPSDLIQAGLFVLNVTTGLTRGVPA